MKRKVQIITVLAVTLIIVLISDRAFSQNVVTNVNVQTSTKAVSKHLNANSDNSELKVNKSENWLNHKSYLDNYSSVESYRIMFALNEKVIEEERIIEDWMFDKNFWKSVNSLDEIIEEVPKEIEGWMLDKEFWKVVK